MKARILSGLIMVMGMVASLGAFLHAFSLWDQVLWEIYLPILACTLFLHVQLYSMEKNTYKIVLPVLLVIVGIIGFSFLREGEHVAYNLVTEVYSTYSTYSFVPYALSANTFMCQLQFTCLFLYVSLWICIGMYSFFTSGLYAIVFLLSVVPFLPVLLYQTPIPWLFALLLLMFWVILLLSGKGVLYANVCRVQLSALVISIICVLLVFFSSSPEDYVLRPSSGNIREHLLQRLDAFAYALTHGKQHMGEVDLENADDRVYTGALQLIVRSQDAAGSVYLKSYSGAVYEDNHWKSLSKSSYDALPNYDWDEVDMWLENKQPQLAYTMKQMGMLMHLEVEDKRTNKQYALTPYLLKEVHPQTTPWFDAYRSEHEDVMQYTSYALPALSLITDNNAQQDAYHLFVQENYLQLPKHLQNLFDEIYPYQTPEITSDKSRVSIIQEDICRFLKDTTTYTLHPGRTPEDEDFITYFLTENKKGYCVHYATSAVMLFRYMGIPARYAEGYSFSSSAMRDGSIEVRDSDAHAWVEIFDEQKGWIPIEVTPADQSESAPSSNTPVEEESEQPAPEEETQTNTPSSNGEHKLIEMQQTKPKETAEFTIPKELLAVMCIIAVWLILELQRGIRIKQRKQRCLQEDAREGITQGYFYLCTYMKKESIEAAVLSICEEALYSTHDMTKEQAELVYAYAIEQGKALRRNASLIKKIHIRYIKAIA